MSYLYASILPYAGKEIKSDTDTCPLESFLSKIFGKILDTGQIVGFCKKGGRLAEPYDPDNPDTFGRNLEGMSSLALKQMGEMARLNASFHPHDSDQFRGWIKASQRYERAARLADEDPRETHGFSGNDS